MLIARFHLPLLIAMLVLGVAAAPSPAIATTLCKVNSTPCPSVSQYASGTTFTATLQAGTTDVTVTSGGLVNPNIMCSNASMTLHSTAVSGAPLPIQVTAMSWSNCICSNPSGNGAKSPNGLPWSGTIAATGSGNGTITIGGLTFTFGCGSWVCTYSATTVTGTLTGGNPATVLITNASLHFTSGTAGCPTSLTWSSNLAVSPAPLYVEFSP